jgi:predicted metal-binding membrane protein
MQVNAVYQAFRSVPRTGYALVGLLGLLTITAWLLVSQLNLPMAGTLDPLALVLFTSIWGIGMVAMMIPSILPMVYMILVHARRSADEQNISPVLRRVMISTRAGLFILGYISIWTLVGLAFYLAIAGLSLAGLPAGLGSVGLWAGLVLVLTGLYQFTRFKQSALMKCRSPMGFIMTRWKQGNVGAGIMGVDYGWFCTRCCWVLMAGLLTVGTMSLPLMGVFAIIIFAEKIGPVGVVVSKIIGILFVAVGVLFLV